LRTPWTCRPRLWRFERRICVTAELGPWPAAHRRWRRKVAQDSARKDEEQARRLGHAWPGTRSFKGRGTRGPLGAHAKKPGGGGALAVSAMDTSRAELGWAGAGPKVTLCQGKEFRGQEHTSRFGLHSCHGSGRKRAAERVGGAKADFRGWAWPKGKERFF
jgi:hypothetical protein